MDNYIPNEMQKPEAGQEPDKAKKPIKVGWWQGSGLKIKIEIGAAVITIIGGLIALVPPIREAVSYLQPKPAVDTPSAPASVPESAATVVVGTSTVAIFGASAYSPTTGIVYVIGNQETREAATMIAQRMCGSNCVTLTAYKNQCFALSRPAGQGIRPGNFYFARAATENGARSEAIKLCEQGIGGRCTITLVNCSPSSLAEKKKR